MKYIHPVFALAILFVSPVFAQKQTFRDGPKVHFPNIKYANEIETNADQQHFREDRDIDWFFLERFMKKCEQMENFICSAKLSMSIDEFGTKKLYIIPPPSEQRINYFYVFGIDQRGAVSFFIYYNIRYWYLPSDAGKDVLLNEDIIGDPNIVKESVIMTNIKSWVTL